MKKLISICIFTFLLLSIFINSGLCAEQESQEFLNWCKSINELHSGTTINVAGATHPSIDAFQKMAPRFTELTGIKVRWDTMNELQLRDKIMIEFSSHTGTYDALMVDCVWLGEFAEKGIIIPLDEYIYDKKYTPEWYNFEDIVPAYREGLSKWKGKYYGLVSAGQTGLLGYRKDLFEKYDVDTSNLDSYKKLLELAKSLNGKEKDLYAIAMRGQRGHNIVLAYFTVLYPLGGRLFDAQEDGKWNVVINSKEGVEALEYLVDLLKYAPPGVENYNSEEQCSAVARGDVFIGLDVSACPPYYEPAGSEAEGNMTYLPPPSGPAGNFAANAGWLLGISKDSNKKDAVWAFMEYMTSPEKVDDFLSVGGDINRISTFKNPEILKSKPAAKPTLEALEMAYNLIQEGVPFWRPPIPEWSKIGEILGYEVNSALIGDKTAKEALDKAAE